MRVFIDIPKYCFLTAEPNFKSILEFTLKVLVVCGIMGHMLTEGRGQGKGCVGFLL